MSCAKKFIIITLCITNMGGAQMYVRNKYIYMQENGWDVDIITAQKGNVYIGDLKKFDYIIQELGFYIYLFPKVKQYRIVNEIIKRVIQKQFDEIIIESTCIAESTWAEVIAQRIGAKHLFYNLQEHDLISSRNIQEFLTFKYSRHELVGIATQSLYNLFLPFNPIDIDASYRLPAYCNNVIEDIECPLLQEIDDEKYDYIDGCLSRIDKSFIFPAINDFISYVNQHADNNYLLLMIGGAPEDSLYEQKIRILFRDISNADIYITGYMFPVPTKLLNICNAFFSSAGSSWACMRSGIPTISYDTNDHKPIGILGRTTQNALMRADNEPEQDFSQLMDDILEREIYGRESQIEQINKPDFSSHVNFMSSMCKRKEYFCFDGVKLDIKETKLSFLLWLIGAENYTKLGALKNRLLTKFN